MKYLFAKFYNLAPTILLVVIVPLSAAVIFFADIENQITLALQILSDEISFLLLMLDIHLVLHLYTSKAIRDEKKENQEVKQ